MPDTPPTPTIPAAPTDPASLWEAVCRTSGEYIAVVDRAGTILFCNRVDDGFSRDQVLGQRFTTLTLPDSSEELLAALQTVFESGEERSLETTVRRLDGQLNYFALRIGPVTIAGRTAAALVCCHSILPLKNTERNLQHERHVLRQLLEIQERERQLVSYEIHDGLSQYLAGAMMHLQALEHDSRDAVPNRDLTESLRLLRAAVDESRRLIGGLRPPALDELGIVDAVESLVEDARTAVDSVDFVHELRAGRLPMQLETTIFRIVQESLSNVRKHAKARTAAVSLTQPDDAHVQVVVQDDGVGFDPAGVPEDRFGLEGIRQRAHLFGSEAEIESAAGRGTTIRVVLPLAAPYGPA